MVNYLQNEDADKLSEVLSVREPTGEHTVIVSEVPPSVSPEDEVDHMQRLVETREKFAKFVRAAGQMQLIMFEKLKDYKVSINPDTNPALLEALRRFTGKDTNVITVDIFKAALARRSEIIVEQIGGTYGTSDGSNSSGTTE